MYLNCMVIYIYSKSADIGQGVSKLYGNITMVRVQDSGQGVSKLYGNITMVRVQYSSQGVSKLYCKSAT